MNLQTGVTTAYFQHSPQDMKISLQTDIGNDPDDALALFLLLQGMKNNDIPKGSLKEIVTTLFNPNQKAAIAAKICHFMSQGEIPIYPGYGSTPKKAEDFTNAYPFWPSVWGIPGFTNAVSLGQGKGFEELPFDSKQIIN